MAGLDAHARRLTCEKIAGEAGALVRSRFGDPGAVDAKVDQRDPTRTGDVVTEVDNLSERLILGRIGEVNRTAVVLAEEGGLTDVDGIRVANDPATAHELWLVDPLDGTVNFAHGVPHFCVSVACWQHGRPVAGAIVDPMVGETFSFEWSSDNPAGRIAYRDGVPLGLSPAVTSAESLVYVGGGAPRVRDLVRSFRSWRRLGSAALALAWVGSGRCGAYVQPGNLHPWDWGAGVPFVIAAGGVVTDAGGSTWAGRIEGTTGLVAAAPAVHSEVQAVLVAAGGFPASS